MSQNSSPETDHKEAEYQAFIWANLKRNYLGNYIHGMLGMTGFRLIHAPTFLPAYLHQISGSNLIVGLALGLQQLGSVISPIVGASQIEHRARIMPAAVWMGGLARVQIVGMALAGWFLKGQALVVAMLVLLFLFGLFMGTQRVVFNMLMAKVIPLSRRGRLQAWRNATGGLIAAILAWAAGKYFIEGNMFGNGYSTTFALSAVLTTAGLWALQILLKEPEPPSLPKRTALAERLKDLPHLIRSEPGYGAFLGVQMLATASRIASPFYILHVGQSMKLTGATLGALSLAFLGADTLSNLVWGYAGDKTGFKKVLIVAMTLWIGSTLLLMSQSSPLMIFIAFCGLGASASGYMMAAQTMILEFGSRDDLPMRLAISSSVEGFMAALCPLLGGLIADQLGLGIVFQISAVCLSAALAMLVFTVADPRRRLKPVEIPLR